MTANQAVLYQEEQRLPAWIWIVIAVPSTLSWYLAIHQLVLDKEIGDKPMPDSGILVMTCIFGVGLPVLFALIRPKVAITNTVIRLSILPLYVRTIPLDNISNAKMVEIRPLQDFGGRGLRWNGKKWGFIIEGSDGIELELSKGLPVVISFNNSREVFALLRTLLDKKAIRKP